MFTDSQVMHEAWTAAATLDERIALRWIGCSPEDRCVPAPCPPSTTSSGCFAAS